MFYSIINLVTANIPIAPSIRSTFLFEPKILGTKIKKFVERKKTIYTMTRTRTRICARKALILRENGGRINDKASTKILRSRMRRDSSALSSEED